MSNKWMTIKLGNSHGLLLGKFWCLERVKETPAKIQTKQAICITAARAPSVPVTL